MQKGDGEKAEEGTGGNRGTHWGLGKENELGRKDGKKKGWDRRRKKQG